MEYLCLIAEIEALKEENARLCQTITGKNVRKIHANPQKVVKSICSCLNMRGTRARESVSRERITVRNTTPVYRRL